MTLSASIEYNAVAILNLIGFGQILNYVYSAEAQFADRQAGCPDFGRLHHQIEQSGDDTGGDVDEQELSDYIFQTEGRRASPEELASILRARELEMVAECLVPGETVVMVEGLPDGAIVAGREKSHIEIARLAASGIVTAGRNPDVTVTEDPTFGKQFP